jgi:hypothetical protein
VALADIGADDPRGVETTGIVDHDRGFSDRAHKIECRGERRIARFFPHDDLNQHHALYRRKEMSADEA